MFPGDFQHDFLSEKNDARHTSLELVWLLKIAGWLSRESNMATEKQKKLS